MHNFTETNVVGIPTTEQSLCMFLWFHCVSVIAGTALYQLWPWNHYTMLLHTIANGI